MANRTLKQEIETDENHATMRESFPFVQNIHFIEYTDVISCLSAERYGCKAVESCAIWFVFLVTCSGGNFWCP